MKALLLAALVAAAPLAAEPLPQDTYARGVELRRSGQAAAAIPFLEAAVERGPADADRWLNLGLAYSAAGQFEAAERALMQAARLAPEYTDVDVARARLLYFRHDYAGAERLLAPVLAKQPGASDARELADRIVAARQQGATVWLLDAAANHGDLSGRLPDARAMYLILRRDLADQKSVTVSMEHVKQFGQVDTYLELGAAWRNGYLALGVTTDADFRPEWAVRGGSVAPSWTTDGWTAWLAADASWARYPVGDVRSFSPSLSFERDGRLMITGRWINTLDERDDYRSGYAVRADWRAAAPLTLSAGWSDAPESEDGRTLTVRAATLGGTLQLTPRTTVRLFGAHEQRRAYDRDEVTLGMSQRF